MSTLQLLKQQQKNQLSQAGLHSLFFHTAVKNRYSDAILSLPEGSLPHIWQEGPS